MRIAGMVAAFLLGAYLSIRVLAALYAVLDLWYARSRTWPRMVRGLVTWGGITAAAAWWLPVPHRGGFVAGLAGYALFFLALFPLRDRALRALGRRTTANGGPAARALDRTRCET